ncbi:hypothetical protein GQ54DRAFT_36066 [Martensiomyces pterosporus]|nr:hypothetical protein GQ54DRAFT_36066 [Martensiomyces pterosporus]
MGWTCVFGHGFVWLCHISTPHGRLIFGHTGGDSPLPPLVEVTSDESPTRVPLVSQDLSGELDAAPGPSELPRMSSSSMGIAMDLYHPDEEGDADEHVQIDDDADESIDSGEDLDEFDAVTGEENVSSRGFVDPDVMDVDENSSSDDGSDASGHESGNYCRSDDEDDHGEKSEDSEGSEEDDSDDEGDEDSGDGGLNTLADILSSHQGIRRNLFGFDLGGIARMGSANQFRPLVAALRKHDDQTQQLVALQELTELLSISTEESLIGLNIGELCQVLINLLKGAGGDYGELTGFIPSNPDIMLLACRCLSNLLEALPLAGAVLVRFGTIEVLCSKLLEIEYIDLAEQALSTLEHLSREFPAKVCDAGGMSACLMFLDFFATSTQRTALACAANCAKGVAGEHFSQAKDTVQVLERTMAYSDQKIVESSCSALLHLVNAFRSSSDQVEQLVSTDLLKSIVRHTRPDSTAASSPPATLLLHILVVVVYSSRERTAQILDMDIIPALEEILMLKCVGLSAAQQSKDSAQTEAGSGATSSHPSQQSSGSVVRVPEQAWEALRLLVALLPKLPSSPAALARAESMISGSAKPAGEVDAADEDQFLRLQAIESRPRVIQQLQHSLVPSMIDIFLSTMNTAARYRSLLVILKIVFYLSTEQLRVTLQDVKLSTFVANTISTPDSPLLSGISLLLVRIILAKLPELYAQRFIREGVANELAELASHTRVALEKSNDSKSPLPESNSDVAMEGEGEGEGEEGAIAGTCLAHGFKILNVHIPNSSRTNPAGSTRQFTLPAGGPSGAISGDMKVLLQWVCSQAQALHDSLQSIDSSLSASGDASILGKLRRISQQLSASTGLHSGAMHTQIEELVACLGSSDSITCYELMQSGLIDTLLGILDGARGTEVASRLVAYLLKPASASESDAKPVAPFNILMHRLQEALDLTEDVQIQEAYQSPSDEARTPTNMLTKQIRFKVVPADAKAVEELAAGSIEDSHVAKEVASTMERVRQSFLPITVSVHAIATFVVLEAYLRPRIALSIGRKRRHKHRDSTIQDSAAAGAARSDMANAESSSTLRPQQAQLERQQASAGEGGQRRHGRSRPDAAQRQHIRMLQMIAQSSGIDLRGAGLLEGLDADMSDDNEASDDGSESGDEHVGRDGEASSNANGSRAEGGDVAASNAANKRAHDWRLVFTLECDGTRQAVSSADNIFRVVNGICRSSEALRNSNLWAHVFTLQFHVEFGQPSPAAAAGAATQRDPNASTAGNHAQHIDKQQLASSVGEQSAAIIQVIKSLHELLPRAVEAYAKEAPASGKTAGAVLNGDALSELFINRKISAKVTRQLDDPLIVVCSAIPRWCHQLVHYTPFLVPLDARFAYLQATSFGYSRNISRWQAIAQREARNGSRTASDVQIPLGRIQRLKVRISRHRMLESALKVLQLYGTAKTILEVEYFDEVGTGLGPTLEFYATVSRSLQERPLGLWRDEGAATAVTTPVTADGQPEYVNAPCGLFPCPIDPQAVSTTLAADSDGADGTSGGSEASPAALPAADRAVQLFKFAGHFIAKGLIDGRILDLPLHEEFWAAVQRHALHAPCTRNDEGAATLPPSVGSELSWTWSQLERVDPGLAKSLGYLQQFVDRKNEVYADEALSADQKLAQTEAIRDPSTGASVDNLSLDFTLPGHPDIELRAGGSGIPVTISNVHAYIDLVASWTLDVGIRSQVRAFCEGFGKIFPVSDLSIFTPAELSRLVGPSPESEDWSMPTLLNSVKADHGFSLSSPAVQMFLSFMECLGNEDRRKFLQFVTGSPRLPFGGFRALHPPLTLVHKMCEPPLVPDDYLPSVMTCANYIKLPDYSSLEVLKRRWNHAANEGQQSFHLS